MKAHFLALKDFLQKYEKLHQLEFLKQYPLDYPSFLRPWIEELSHWDFANLAKLESEPNEDLVVNKEFKTFLKTIRHLSTLDQKGLKETTLNIDLKRKLNPKKIHEIQILKTLVDNVAEIETLIDIGGGKGHLSCALINDKLKEAISLDRDLSLQNMGKEKISSWLPNHKERVCFQREDFKADSKIKFNFNPAKSIVIGLHGCGHLSSDTILFAAKNKLAHLLSIGCCYHKLETNFHLSSLGKGDPLFFSNNALHLASRCGSRVDEGDLIRRYRFKRFRYSLHYYLNDHFSLPFISLGNSTKADYHGSFSDYAKNNYPGEELKDVKDKELNDYFEDKNTKEKVKANYLADTIRLFTGRLIELYIVLDRALYLEEHGLSPKISELFNPKVSPLNILIEY